MSKRLFSTIFSFFIIASTFTLFASPSISVQPEPKELNLFKRAYPDLTFKSTYDAKVKDFLITITCEDRTADFYWQNGSLLPPQEVQNAENYWTLLYSYVDKIPDPKDFTPEDIERIRNFSSKENRTNGAKTPPFFYDLIYDCKTRAALEKHIIKHTFLGKNTIIHERIKEPLRRVEKKILDEAKVTPEVQTFIDNLLSADCYNWREIQDSGNRSFHSLGIALDILPKGWGQKNVYWAWRRDFDKDWMLLPLNRRWTPPEKVIEIFESEGFIYGGKWIIWDNMHFEYHPEIILYNSSPSSKAASNTTR